MMLILEKQPYYTCNFRLKPSYWWENAHIYGTAYLKFSLMFHACLNSPTGDIYFDHQGFVGWYNVAQYLPLNKFFCISGNTHHYDSQIFPYC